MAGYRFGLTLAVVLLVGGCAVQNPGAIAGSDGDSLRRALRETRVELEEIKRDQERLRAVVEYLQYQQEYGPLPDEPLADPTPPAVASQGPTGDAAALDSLGLLGMEAELPRLRLESLLAPDDPPPPAADTDAAVAVSPPGPPVGFPKLAEIEVAGSGPGGQGAFESADPQLPGRVPLRLRGTGYDDGVRALSEDQYDDAVQYFRNFIYKHPSSSYTDDAQFWIGEAYVRKGRYSSAIKELNQVVLRYGGGDRAAGALLRLADVFGRIGDEVDERLSLQKLINLYPATPEAGRATHRLEAAGG
ncbi:MAG: tol-pal system protein YbgF [Deltaproteobacteria bacterium]